MMTDPYSVLGIAPSASNDDVKRAYRELSRKYHPDSYVDNPLSELAEEKFKEVQEAYKQIMNERESSYSNGNYGNAGGAGGAGGFYGGTGGNGYSYNNNSSNDMMDVCNLINSGRYRDALTVLNRVPNRDAQWFYFSAVANQGMGNNFVALDHARQATNMAPGNQEYRAFLNRIQNTNVQYSNRGQNYGRGNSDDMCDMCVKLWCADSLCECMGGDLCRCI